MSRFLAKILIESLSEFEVDNGNGNGIGSDGEVKTKKENIPTAIIAMIKGGFELQKEYQRLKLVFDQCCKIHQL